MATLFLVLSILSNTFLEAWPEPSFGSISSTGSETRDGDEIWVVTEDKFVTDIENRGVGGDTKPEFLPLSLGLLLLDPIGLKFDK